MLVLLLTLAPESQVQQLIALQCLCSGFASHLPPVVTQVHSLSVISSANLPWPYQQDLSYLLSPPHHLQGQTCGPAAPWVTLDPLRLLSITDTTAPGGALVWLERFIMFLLHIQTVDVYIVWIFVYSFVPRSRRRCEFNILGRFTVLLQELWH